MTSCLNVIDRGILLNFCYVFRVFCVVHIYLHPPALPELPGPPERTVPLALPEPPGEPERTVPLALPAQRALPDPPGPQVRRVSPQKARPAMAPLAPRVLQGRLFMHNSNFCLVMGR